MTYVKTYLPTLKTHIVILKRDAKDQSRDLQRLEVRGKLGSKTLYYGQYREARPQVAPCEISLQISVQTNYQGKVIIVYFFSNDGKTKCILNSRVGYIRQRGRVEWSEAKVLGTSLFGGVGSNPNAVNYLFKIHNKNNIRLPKLKV